MVKKEAKITIAVKKEPKREVEDELKPGQKFATPTPGFADRVFYETLLSQRPNSEMAQEWCVAYGVLPDEEAIKLNDKVFKRKRKNGASPDNRGDNAAPKKTATRKKSQNNIMDGIAVDPGMQIGGEEGIGTAVY